MGLHWYDLLGLVVLGLIVFGPKKLPEMGSSLGKTIREFQKSMREVTNPEPPSSVPPSATQTAQPVAPAADTQATVIASAPESTTASTAAASAAAEGSVQGAVEDQAVEAGAPHLVEEESVH